MPSRCRQRLYYSLILALPIVTFTVLLAMGRWQTYWALFWRAFHERDSASAEAFNGSLVTGVIWSLSTMPLVLTAWNRGDVIRLLVG